MRPVAILALIASISAVCAAAALTDFEKVKEIGGIEEYRLRANGLSVLLLEDHSAPVVTFGVMYQVGSRNDPVGAAGEAHLLEHMMFRGTARFNERRGNSYDAVLARAGASSNAETDYDCTHYYATVPSEYLDVVTELEADRMRALSLRDEDRKLESAVVRNEYEEELSGSPSADLLERVYLAVIGGNPDEGSSIRAANAVRSVSTAQLRELYDAYYWPNNATVTVVGDFQKEHALDCIKRCFAGIPRSPKPVPHPDRKAPEQRRQRLIAKGTAQPGFVVIGYKVPGGWGPETYALAVLAKILSGDVNGGRLDQALTDSGITSDANASLVTLKDSGVFQLVGCLSPGTSYKRVESGLISQVEEIQMNGVSQEELARAVAQLEADTTYERDGSLNTENALEDAIASGDWTAFATALDHLKQVTPLQVQEASQKYLVATNCTHGSFIPTELAPVRRPETTIAGPPGWSHREHLLVSTKHERRSMRDPVWQPGTPVRITDRIRRCRAAGIDLIIVPANKKGIVSLAGAFGAGGMLDPEGKPGVSLLTAAMVSKGTTQRNRIAVAHALESLGGTLEFDSDDEATEIHGKCLTRNLPPLVALLAEQLREPAFPAGEFEKLKQQHAVSCQSDSIDPDSMGTIALTRHLFPRLQGDDVPFPKEQLAALQQITVDDIKRFHQKYYGPKSFTLVVVGDVEIEPLRDAVEKVFSGWEGGIGYSRDDFPPLADTRPRTIVISIPGKESVWYGSGIPIRVPVSSSEAVQLEVANEIFGGATFMSRLLKNVRDREGLTYNVGSEVLGDTEVKSAFVITGWFAPDCVRRGLASIEEQLRSYCATGPTRDELREAKQYLTGAYKIHLATTQDLADEVLSCAEQGRDLSSIDRYAQEIEAVNLDQVNRTLRKHLRPSHFVTVLAGTVSRVVALGHGRHPLRRPD